MLLLDHLVVDLVAMLEVIEHLAWSDMQWSVGGDLGLLPHEDQLRILCLQISLFKLMRLGDEAIDTLNILRPWLLEEFLMYFFTVYVLRMLN